MGNWHCVNSSCAKVVYREYKPPVIRYRYLGESWTEIQGNNLTYTTEQIYQGTYPCVSTITYRADPNPGTPATNVLDNLQWSTGVDSDEIILVQQNELPGLSFCPTVPKAYFVSNKGRFLIDINTCHTITKTDESIVCNYECVFKVFDNDNLVYVETRDECPEVEILPCSLSDEIKQIKVEKLPFLERVEIVDYGYTNFGLNTVSYSLPNECLNIFLNDVSGAIPPFNILLPGIYNSWKHITQICSAPGCPPPEYDVVCDCDNDECESCPEGTCAVECGDHICCYNQFGTAIKSINIDNYCSE